MDRSALRSRAWLAGVVALCGVWLVQTGSDLRTAAPQPSAAQAFASGPGMMRPGSSATGPLRSSPPVRVRIPAIGVDAPMTGLRLGEDGSLAAPPAADRNLAGWFEDGTAPGAAGTAIVAGHVDNAEGPSVFYSLGSLKKGATVEIDRRDGRTAVFSVDAVEVYEKDEFPDERVYGATPHPSLRLITCGGGFSRDTGYLGNVVAYAHLTDVR
ncbi:class F sortase [Streptomyces sp. NPDC051840]|uniref:class F sortase n=1 Tax=unclassified Streptomyces TaxID=2593676 RepID=UPI00343A60A1